MILDHFLEDPATAYHVALTLLSPHILAQVYLFHLLFTAIQPRRYLRLSSQEWATQVACPTTETCF